MGWFKRLRGRLTGLSTPFGGVSFKPAVVDADVARALIAFLENRRVLYAPDEAEITEECVLSVIEIRHRLTEVLEHGGLSAKLAERVHALRGAALRFNERLGARDKPDDVRQIIGGRNAIGLDDWVLNQALGELRGVFGIHIGSMAESYGLAVRAPLSSILPRPDDP